jgi:hypothetical protein
VRIPLDALITRGSETERLNKEDFIKKKISCAESFEAHNFEIVGSTPTPAIEAVAHWRAAILKLGN